MPSTQGKEGYGYAFTRGTPVEMANACLNNQYQGRGTGISFKTWQRRTGKGDANRGWGGLPRVPGRCQVGTTGVCICSHNRTERNAA